MSNDNPHFGNHNLNHSSICRRISSNFGHSVPLHSSVLVQPAKATKFCDCNIAGKFKQLQQQFSSSPHPCHKYEKGKNLRGEDGTCAVCLCEFEEGDELRTLPGCMHSFQVPCIDMWLYSHTSCPMCRSDAAPSPSPMISRSGLDLESSEVEVQESETLQEIVVQSS